MENKKLTKAQKFEMLANIEAVKADPILAEFIAKELALLDKKSEKRKPTATQQANIDLMNAICAGMENGRAYSIGELIKEVPECAGLSNQKVTAMVRMMMPERLTRVVEKRQPKYIKVEAE